MDKEDFIFTIVDIFKNNLNTEISAINTAKGDSVLETIPTDAYFVQQAGEESLNFNPFIFFYISFAANETIQSHSMDQIGITVLTVFNDEANGDFEMVRKLLRYQKALKNVAENNFYTSNIGNNITVNSVEPVLFNDQDSNTLVKTCGIELQSYIN